MRATDSARSSAKYPSEYAAVIPTAYSCGDSPICGCEAVGCGAASCDGGCDSAGGSDEPWKLIQRSILGFNIGGWSSVGYHTYDNPGIFNNHSDNVRLHQAWVFAERVADGSKGLGVGGRIDYLYGVDAQDTQAFGVAPENGHWDSSWDNGIYGHAIPQLYAEFATGDFSVKVGKFFTIIGYEVVAATGNFFYSHSYTMYNSEPFTHTGVLSSYKMSDDITVFNGWVMGWDSGFQDNGDAYLGGATVKLTDNTSVTSSVVAGRFGKGDNDETGYMFSNIITSQLSDKLTYVFWTDVLDTDRTGRARERKTFDLNQYLLYQVSDNLVWGNRIEWYNVDRGVFGAVSSNDIYAYTTGFNYRVGSNMLFRPELRWDWDKGGLIGLERGRVQTTFGTDMIFTF
ncbi:MAG: porin [Pirellulaceae bacterium]|nr:porin [Pirellulaceae bacterium]